MKSWLILGLVIAVQAAIVAGFFRWINGQNLGDGGFGFAALWYLMLGVFVVVDVIWLVFLFVHHAVRWLHLFLLALLCSAAAFAAECPNVPLPAVAAGVEKTCEKAYVSLYDAKLHVPRVVAYELTSQRTLGCLPRRGSFHSEGSSAKPSAFLNSGYDLGHMMSAEDAAWDDEVSYQSFSMLNVAPQVPGLNRQEWERLEEAVRAWAWERGDVYVYVGPVVDDKRPKKLDNSVAVPVAFWKVIVDRKTGETLSFRMPQRSEPKGDLAFWLTSLGVIEAEAEVEFPGSHGERHDLWPLNLPGWRQAHKKACAQ